ncbi:MAG: DUF1385 domain-containing protein [Actinobacteria bacterium]|nr:MAG: DUF1385 domain-containing protein [Actinomycetota bacterium]
MAGKKQQHFYGGQAVLEGVMMRGKDTWALAVRRPNADIYVEENKVKGLAAKYPLFRKPLFRGVAALGEAMSIGVRALTTSANQALEEEEKLSTRQMAMSMVLAFVFFIAIFIVLPAIGVNFFSKKIHHSLTYNLIEGVVRVGIFVGYLVGISFVKEIRRVFMYHGAEHKTIAAYEAGEPVLEPGAVDKYSTLHVRCGTNFLIIVMLLTVFIFSFFGRPAIWLRIIERIVAIPLLAGISYEALRLGANHGSNPIVKALMKPGLWLQKITTRPPTHDQIEVAIRSFEAVLPQDERGRVPALPSPIVSRADFVAPDPAEPQPPPTPDHPVPQPPAKP